MVDRRSGLISRISWGLFFIGIGAIWMTQDIHQLEPWALALVLAGCILIGGNIVKAGLRVKISAGSLGVGFVLLLVGASMLQEIKLNWFGLLLLLVGAWILLDALAKRR